MRRYRDQLIFALTILLCFVYVGLWGQDPPAKPAPTVTLKPGDEVKPLELEAAKLGKLKAEIARDEAQETVLQQQFSNLENDKRELQMRLDALVKEVAARVKKETGAEVSYDARIGEDGSFRVTTPPPAAAQTKEKEKETKKP
jgi:hypothetical protein